MANLPGPSGVNPLDDNYETVVSTWLRELEALDENEDDAGTQPQEHELEELLSDVDDGDYIESEHQTESEMSNDSDPELEEPDTSIIETPSNTYYYGKNRFKWSSKPPTRNIRTLAHNIIRLPCNKPAVAQENPFSPLESFQHIFDLRMMDIVLKWTNKKLEKIRSIHVGDYNFRECNIIELKALLSLLFYSAVFKSNRESILSLFATDGTGREIFRASMSIKRFCALLVALRFDDFENREARKIVDPGCAISEVLDLFNENSQKCYSIGANATVDEMLIAFRGRCKFKMYMPSKPAKYGLKMQCLADSRTHYICNTYLYTGKGSDASKSLPEDIRKSIPTQAVLRLCRPIFNSNRNVTTDNWYSSMELLTSLRERKLTTIGTLKKNKAIIPKEFLPNKNRDVGTALFGFTNDCTLVSYVPKKNKAVVLYSSMHHSNEIGPNAGKPIIIEDYNSTKGGVDSVDQKCSIYSCSRRTTRWPMAIFFRILDMSGLNAYILHQSHKRANKLSRLNFLKALAANLNENNLRSRLYNTKIPRQLRTSISSIIGIEVPEEVDPRIEKLPRDQRQYCTLCHYKKRTKTAYLCCKCFKPICLSCAKKICNNCVQRE